MVATDGQHWALTTFRTLARPWDWGGCGSRPGTQTPAHALILKLAPGSTSKIVSAELHLRPDSPFPSTPEDPRIPVRRCRSPGSRRGVYCEAQVGGSTRTARLGPGRPAPSSAPGAGIAAAPVARPRRGSHLGRKLHAAEMSLPSPRRSFLPGRQKT